MSELKRPVRPEKLAAVEEIKSHVQDASIVALANYRGLTVNEMTDLRAQLRPFAHVKVYKNTLSRRVFDDLSLSYDKEMLIGPSLMICGKEDVVEVSKVLVKFAKQSELFQIKGGLLNKAAITAKEVAQLAALPSRDELIAKTVGSIKSPLTNFVTTLSGPLRGLVYVLNSIKDKKSEVDNV